MIQKINGKSVLLKNKNLLGPILGRYLSRKHNYIIKAAMAREKKIVLLVTTTAPATLVLTFVLTFVHLSRQLKQGLVSSVRHSKDFDIRSASSASGAQACSDIHLAVHCNLAGVQLKKTL